MSRANTLRPPAPDVATATVFQPPPVCTSETAIGPSTSTLQILVDELTEHIAKAIAEGDLRAGLDPGPTAAGIVAGMAGAELLSSALANGADLRSRFAKNWELLLPALVTDESLGYYREFLARQAVRPPTTP